MEPSIAQRKTAPAPRLLEQVREAIRRRHDQSKGPGSLICNYRGHSRPTNPTYIPTRILPVVSVAC